jgi:phosphohistidine phosphatase
MELTILRHGTAEDSNPGGDAARNLIEKGRLQSRDVAELLKSSGLLPEIVLTSPFARARQTAEEFCHAAGIPAPVIQPWLASGMRAETALNELVGFREFSRVMIVGHEPDLSELIQWTLAAHGNAIEMRKGTVACLRIFPPAKSGTLIYLAPPSIAGNP